VSHVYSVVSKGGGSKTVLQTVMTKFNTLSMVFLVSGMKQIYYIGCFIIVSSSICHVSRYDA